MKNLLIYYQQPPQENIESSISFIDRLIKKNCTHYNIKGVFIDSYKEKDKFLELIQSPLDDINSIMLIGEITDEFDNQLLKELAKVDNFEILQHI